MFYFHKQVESTVKDFFYFLGGLFFLASQTFYFIFRRPFRIKDFLVEFKKAGMESLPIVSLISLFIGIILALQTAVQMQRLGSEMYIANIVSLSLVRELGPVITALVVAGRVGAGMTAQIGSMQITEQIDALETLAVNPVKFLVVPRLLALALGLPLLTLYANIIGILGGWFICVTRLGISSQIYFNNSFDALLFKDLFSGLIKTVVFGMLISLVCCYEGFKVKEGAEAVGQAVRRAVVKSFVFVLLVDCIFTALFYFFFP
ncbi:MAG: ABC transporter permease [Candidatus Omnitrophica bacterium]|nr:ABC transporter permease [Candidatus Omnitrophota bacterium]